MAPDQPRHAIGAWIEGRNETFERAAPGWERKCKEPERRGKYVNLGKRVGHRILRPFPVYVNSSGNLKQLSAGCWYAIRMSRSSNIPSPGLDHGLVAAGTGPAAVPR